MTTHYRALKDITTTEGLRKAGDMVPEAKDWKNVRAWIGSHLEEVMETVPAPTAHAPSNGLVSVTDFAPSQPVVAPERKATGTSSKPFKGARG